ncbi:MAG: glutamine-hydrolyzing carbamoyl-phosphate synthase small subunit [Bacillota bacterium]
MKGILYLEDGTIYKGKGFGKKGTSVGELVFNTSITGYQEILTDPSYAGQIITMTYPLIGNYGVNPVESESSKIHAQGFVVKSISKTPSNYMSEKTIEEMLEGMGIVGVCDVDTRSITKKIRNEGALKCVISNEELSMEELEAYLKKAKTKDDWMKDVSTEKVYHIPGNGCKVALVDFGVKGNIINNLKHRDCDITVFPHNATFEQIMEIKPQGVLLSNGPGDPKMATEAIETVKQLMGKIPIFGICLGHQILALAVGGDTYKMKYGHRGGNHGVYDIDRDRAYITSQNHGFAVDPKSVEGKGMVITHTNLNDQTVEGMKHKELPVYSVQFHPEGAPGPTDSAYLFEKFLAYMKEDTPCL